MQEKKKNCVVQYLHTYVRKIKKGSCALPGLMLDLGLLKWFEGVFFLFLTPAGSSNPAEPYPYSLYSPEGQS